MTIELIINWIVIILSTIGLFGSIIIFVIDLIGIILYPDKDFNDH